MDSGDDGIVSALFNLFLTSENKTMGKYRSIVRMMASAMPLKPIIRPFSQVQNGIRIYDVDQIEIPDLNCLMSFEDDEYDCRSAYSDYTDGLADMKSITQQSVMNRFSIATNNVQHSTFSEGGTYTPSLSVTDQARINNLELELEFLKTQITLLTGGNGTHSNHSSNQNHFSEIQLVVPPEAPPYYFTHEKIDEISTDAKGRDLEDNESTRIDEENVNLLNKIYSFKQCKTSLSFLDELKNVKLSDERKLKTPSTDGPVDSGEFLTEALKSKFSSVNRRISGNNDESLNSEEVSFNVSHR